MHDTYDRTNLSADVLVVAAPCDMFGNCSPDVAEVKEPMTTSPSKGVDDAGYQSQQSNTLAEVSVRTLLIPPHPSPLFKRHHRCHTYRGL